MKQENEFVTWLLGASTPSIKYLTLTRLRGISPRDDRVIKAQQEIMLSRPVPSLLDHQTKMGNWRNERSYYTPKYVSTHWSLMLLTELCIDGADPRFRQGAQYMLDATANSLKLQLGAHKHDLACFWGNLLRYALHAGMGEHPQVQKVIQYLIWDIQDGSCCCNYNDGHACAWGVVRALWGLSALHESQRTPEVIDSIRHSLKFLLEAFQLIKADYPVRDKGKINPIWFRLNFPLFYQVDILFALRILGELNALSHPGAQASLDWLAQKRKQDGGWQGSSPFRQRTWPELGDQEEIDRWVSLQAAQVLMQAGRIPRLTI